MEKRKPYKSVSKHSLENLKYYHNEAINFFAAELMMLKEIIPKITDERQKNLAVLLMSCTQTGSALLQLANQTDTFTSESIMLSRAFMEKITNFCYVSICDENEYRAFMLHPIYKQYHYIGSFKKEDDVKFDRMEEEAKKRKEKQNEFREKAIVKEALEIFSDKNPNMNWTKKTLNQRIDGLEKWGKFLDVFFRLSKIEYYSNASEALHGSLYGCCFGIGTFDPDFDHNRKNELDKKLYKESACNLLHLGTLIHQTFTLISYSTDIEELCLHSQNNVRMALNLKFHILEKKIPGIRKKKTT